MVTHPYQLKFQIKIEQVKIFLCPICDFTETQMGNLKHHFRPKHKGRGIRVTLNIVFVIFKCMVFKWDFFFNFVTTGSTLGLKLP